MCVSFNRIELAAALSQVGGLSLPPETAERYYRGEQLSESEQALVHRLPLAAARLVRHISRLDGVHDLLREVAAGGKLSRRAQALCLVDDVDMVETQGLTPELALATVAGRDAYDADLVEALGRVRGASAASGRVAEIPLQDVSDGMVFIADVLVPSTGVLLIPRGQSVGDALLARIRALPFDTSSLTVRVLVPADLHLQRRPLRLFGGPRRVAPPRVSRVMRCPAFMVQ